MRGSTRFKSLPDGTTTGDTPYWDNDKKAWVILPAPSAEGTWFRAMVDGEPTWVEADEDCAPTGGG